VSRVWRHDSKKSERKPLKGWLTSQTTLSLGNKSANDLTYVKSVVMQNTTKRMTTLGVESPSERADLFLSPEMVLSSELVPK
jgi:hypothetical protein